MAQYGEVGIGLEGPAAAVVGTGRMEEELTENMAMLLSMRKVMPVLLVHSVLMAEGIAHVGGEVVVAEDEVVAMAAAIDMNMMPR